MPRVFISYKRADKDKVFALKDKIEAAIGEKCWIDLEDIDCDVNSWEDKIIHAINEASIFLFMYSTHVAEIKDEENDRTLDEFSFARSKNKRIVFINIDQTPLTDKYAFRFGQRQQVDATSEQTINKLVEDIKIWLNKENISSKQENVRSIATQVVTELTSGIVEAYSSGLSNFKQQVFNISSGLKYRYDKLNLTAEVIGVENTHLEALVIPSSVYHRSKKYTIVGIKEKAFENHFSFTLVKLPETITYIGSGAFRKCENLSSIIIPENVETIGDEAFEGCANIVDIKLPSKIESIAHASFRGCTNLTDVILHTKIKEIGRSAFEGCSNLRSINLPPNIKRIGASAFAGCGRLKSITIPESVTEIGSSAFEGCQNLTDIILSCYIPEIRESVFQDCSNLRSIIIPPSVVRILRYAFLKCEKLEEVIMGNRIQRIGQSAFFGCNSLKKVVLPINTFFEHGTFPQTCEIIRK